MLYGSKVNMLDISLRTWPRRCQPSAATQLVHYFIKEQVRCKPQFYMGNLRIKKFGYKIFAHFHDLLIQSVQHQNRGSSTISMRGKKSRQRVPYSISRLKEENLMMKLMSWSFVQNFFSVLSRQRWETVMVRLQRVRTLKMFIF